MALKFRSKSEIPAKHDAKVMLAVHGLLFLLFLIFLVPAFPMFKQTWDGETPLPPIYRLWAGISLTVGKYILLLPVMLGLLALLDTYIYIQLRTRYRKAIASIWVIAIFLVLMALQLCYLRGVTSPLRANTSPLTGNSVVPVN